MPFTCAGLLCYAQISVVAGILRAESVVVIFSALQYPVFAGGAVLSGASSPLFTIDGDCSH